ncbi:MAG TPA: hypothetical protein VF059_10210 [Casimicrobiaceae bacterium]
MDVDSGTNAVAGNPSRLHLAAVFGLSAATLAFEILLLRLFEFSHWHYFAGFAVALALLGFGAAGTTLAALGRKPVDWGDRWFLAGLLTTALGLYAALAVQAHVALRPIFAGWDARELGKLLLVDVMAFVPFYGAGLAIGQVFVRWPHRTRALYAANLLGSGVGSAGASLLLAFASVTSALAIVGLLLLALGLWLSLAQRERAAAGMFVIAFAGVLPFSVPPPEPRVSDFKALARVRELPDVRVLAAAPGLDGELTLFRSESLRYAPGLSLAWPEPAPVVDVAIIGGDVEVPLPRAFPLGAPHASASLAGLPFVLRPHCRVLVLGASAWQTPGLGSGAETLTWVEPDERLLELARLRGALPPRYTLVADNPYRHLARTAARYDVIVADRAYDGGDAASEDYLFTVEGIALALRRLAPDGLLIVPLRLQLPPRHLPRVLTTIREALERQGAAAPGAHVAALRGLQTQLLLVAAAPLARADRDALRAFARQWQFDFDWLPDVTAAETNRYNRLEAPVFHATARAILTGEGSLPHDATWFATDAARLRQPYLWRSLLWKRAPDFIATLGPRGLSYLDWSLLFSAATVAFVTVAAFLLILAPLGRLPAIAPPLSRAGVAGYFGLLGLGYMLVEIAVFQRAILFCDRPVLAASVVFAAFLIGSGIGSATAPEARVRRTTVRIFGIVAMTLVMVAIALFVAADALLVPSLPLRLALVTLLILPLAFAMGRPFPWALRQLGDQPRWIPWAWAINGFASVAAAAAAPLVSVHWGQPMTLLAGLVCYLAAMAVALRWTSAP